MENLYTGLNTSQTHVGCDGKLVNMVRHTSYNIQYPIQYIYNTMNIPANSYIGLLIKPMYQLHSQSTYGYTGMPTVYVWFCINPTCYPKASTA